MVGGGHGEPHGHGEHHGHGAHKPPYVIPDYRKYKVEDAYELHRVQRMLAQKGLKNPWLRNHVWRYDPAWGTVSSRTRSMLTRGMKWGLLAALATIGAEKAYDHFFPTADPHHPHGHH